MRTKSEKSTKDNKTIDESFARARQNPPVVPFEQLRSAVEKAAADRSAWQRFPILTMQTGTIIMIVSTITTAVLFFALLGHPDDSTKDNAVVLPTTRIEAPAAIDEDRQAAEDRQSALALESGAASKLRPDTGLRADGAMRQSDVATAAARTAVSGRDAEPLAASEFRTPRHSDQADRADHPDQSDYFDHSDHPDQIDHPDQTDQADLLDRHAVAHDEIVSPSEDGPHVQGVRLLRLSAQELMKLGISLDGQTFRMQYRGVVPHNLADLQHHQRSGDAAPSRSDQLERGKDPRAHFIALHLLAHKVKVTFDEAIGDRDAASAAVPDFIPAIIMFNARLAGEEVDDRKWDFWYLDPDPALRHEEQQARMQQHASAVQHAAAFGIQQIQTLLPLYVHIENGEEADLHLILWYRTQAAVIEKLPSTLRAALAPELEQVMQFGGDPAPAREDFQGKAIFDIWRSSAGALAIQSTSPNPAGDQVWIKYKLTDSRRLTLSLHDLFGRKLGALPVQTLDGSAGDNSVQLDLRGVAAGVYLLALTSDRGEQAVQRLVISR